MFLKQRLECICIFLFVQHIASSNDCTNLEEFKRAKGKYTRLNQTLVISSPSEDTATRAIINQYLM